MGGGSSATSCCIRIQTFVSTRNRATPHPWASSRCLMCASGLRTASTRTVCRNVPNYPLDAPSSRSSPFRKGPPAAPRFCGSCVTRSRTRMHGWKPFAKRCRHQRARPNPSLNNFNKHNHSRRCPARHLPTLVQASVSTV